ncbi:MAG: hypothetical protein QOF18_1675 [Frankiaceae bacterium]|nr:hypothetical protein [Frankiaceae bacterium]
MRAVRIAGLLAGLLGAGLVAGPADATRATLRTPAERGVVAAPATIAPGKVHIAFHRVAGGFSDPTYVTSASDGLARLYVVEQAGRVRIVTHGRVQSTPYLDLHNEVACCGERGLLSIAFHPQFGKHHFVYAAYTRSDGALQVSRFTAASPTATHIAASTEQRILTVPHSEQSNHNGGQLLFGRSGLFYITTGDGGGGGDPYGRPEDLTSLSGKLLRLDVDRHCGSHHYCAPSSNPFANASNANKRLVFDWGLRNPWRISVDRADGTLWIGDVGQDAWEEVDHVRAAGGRDFGWSCREGRSTYNAGRCSIGGKPRSMTAPVVVYHHDAGRCAIIGGYAYHGSKYSFAHGLYVYADYCTGETWVLGRTSSGGYPSALVGDDSGSITGFGQGDAGELFSVDQSGNLNHLVFSRA